MKQIILIRHGQSVGNEMQVGGTDESTYVNDMEISLTDVGRQQAFNCALKLRDYKEKYWLEKWEMWNSPFLRTRQTAEIINSELKFEKVYEDPRLVEQDFGDFDFQFYDKWKELSPHSWFINQMRYKSRMSKFFARIENGENLADVYNRVSLFDLSRCQNEKNQIIVTHGAFIKAAIMYFTGEKVEYICDLKPIKNASAHILIKDENSSVFEYKGEL